MVTTDVFTDLPNRLDHADATELLPCLTHPLVHPGDVIDPRVATSLDPAMILLDFFKTSHREPTKPGFGAFVKELANRLGQVLLVVLDRQDVIPATTRGKGRGSDGEFAEHALRSSNDSGVQAGMTLQERETVMTLMIGGPGKVMIVRQGGDRKVTRHARGNGRAPQLPCVQHSRRRRFPSCLVQPRAG